MLETCRSQLVGEAAYLPPRKARQQLAPTGGFIGF